MTSGIDNDNIGENFVLRITGCVLDVAAGGGVAAGFGIRRPIAMNCVKSRLISLGFVTPHCKNVVSSKLSYST